MLSKVCGRFTGVFGAIAVADDPTESRLEVTIDMASAESGDRARDDHLRSPDFFDELVLTGDDDLVAAHGRELALAAMTCATGWSCGRREFGALPE